MAIEDCTMPAYHCGQLGKAMPKRLNAWGLDKGIVLEDEGLLLPWGISFDALCALGRAALNRQADSLHPSWSKRRVMGRVGELSACRLLTPPNPRCYHIHLPTFHYARFQLEEKYDTRREAQDAMRRIHDEVVAMTATAATSYPNYQEGLPSIMWRFENVDIHLGPSCRYDTSTRPATLREVRLDLAFSHEPDGYDDLKLELASIRAREGRGREVDYVAWDGALADALLPDLKHT